MKNLIALLFSLILGFKSFAQPEFINDAAIWTGVKISKKINKKNLISLTQQCRFDENISQLGRISIGIDAVHKINKNLRINFGYNYLRKIDLNSGYFNENRIVLGFTTKTNFRKFDFSYRNIAQIRYKQYLTSEDGKIPKVYNRNRIAIQYELNKRFSLTNSYEIYIPLNKTEIIEINRLRSIAELNYKLSKKTSIRSYFLFQTQFHTDELIERKFVYGFEFSHEL